MTTRLLFLVSCYLLGGLLCQEVWAQKPNKNRKVEFKIITAAVHPKESILHVPKEPNKIKEGKYSGEWQTIRLNLHTTEGPHKVRIGKSLTFFSSEDIATKPSVKVNLTSGVEKWLLLMLPKTGGGYTVRPIPDGEIAWRHYGIFNLTGSPLKVELAGKVKVIKDKQSAIMPSANKAQWVKITGVVKGKPRILRQTKWLLDANQREFVIYYRMKNGNISARHVIDHRADKKPE